MIGSGIFTALDPPLLFPGCLDGSENIAFVVASNLSMWQVSFGVKGSEATAMSFRGRLESFGQFLIVLSVCCAVSFALSAFLIYLREVIPTNSGVVVPTPLLFLSVHTHTHRALCLLPYCGTFIRLDVAVRASAVSLFLCGVY